MLRKIILFRGCIVFGLRSTITAAVGINHNNITDLSGNPMSQEFDPQPVKKFQACVMYSSKMISHWFGMEAISEKKIKDETNKNIVKNGAKIILPKILAAEIGIPQ
ncbi:hypothetical protein HN446_04905 [bacterium]|jgi:hypothetical protein|nr:hypothetical protein [bacterium]